MQAAYFEEVLENILARDKRFTREAYFFVREATDYTQKMASEKNKEQVRHVSGQELLEGIRQYALQKFGPMAMLVLSDWGVHKGEDFGEIVFNLIDAGLFSKTEKDTREDFKGGYDFFEAFRQPFLPSKRATANGVLPSEKGPAKACTPTGDSDTV